MAVMMQWSLLFNSVCMVSQKRTTKMVFGSSCKFFRYVYLTKDTFLKEIKRKKCEICIYLVFIGHWTKLFALPRIYN